MVEKNLTMEELMEINVDVPQPIVTLYDKNGNETNDDYNAVAKSVQNITKLSDGEIDKTSFYLKHRRGQIFDPYGIDAHKFAAQDTNYKLANEKIFDDYIQYLKTRRTVFLTIANRNLLELR